MTRRPAAARLALVGAAAALALSACGDDDDGAADTGNGTGTGSGTQAAQAPESLVAAVGADDEYVISLTDPAGAEITNLKAGRYDVAFKDESDIHNFHVTGGGVDEKTTVEEVVERTMSITFNPGQYTFLCDPHPQTMKGSFTVS